MRSFPLLFILIWWPYLCAAEPVATNDLQRLIDGTRTLRALMQSDPHRPIYHFVAPEGHAAPFDPNGALYWRGKYHLGFIYQKPRSKRLSYPTADFLENSVHVWGHAVSTDLLHWTLYPDMLDAKENDSEEGIFFSGGAFVSREGVPHIIYYARGMSSNMIAYATDESLTTWRKFEGNPVLQELDPDDQSRPKCCVLQKGAYSVFDPDAWYDHKADVYYQISGGMQPALFKSKDMHEWKYLGDLIDKNKTMRLPEEDLSCPDFFSLGDKSMLVFISHLMGAQYYIGTFANDKFTPEQHGRMNWPGGSFFAPEQLQDDKGRNIIWGWVVERKPPHLPDYGWSGIMSLPRVLTLGDDGKLRISPPEEIKTIRLEESRDEDIELAPNSERTLKARGKSIELQLEFSGMERSPAGVKVFASPDGREKTIISYDPVSKELIVDFSKSSVKGPVTYPVSFLDSGIAGYPKKISQQRAPLPLKHGEPLELNIFLDNSMIEIFANGIQCVTQVVYPELADSTAVEVFNGNEPVTIKNIRSWTMAESNAY